jgi:stress-induced-phosphoprotein 1
MPNAQAEALKAKGNAHFQGGRYQEAIDMYKQATAIDDSVPAYWSNMAACYEKLGDYENMADASRSCIRADRSFVKGYFRLATAQRALKDTAGAVKTLESGLAVESSNADLKKMKKELQEDARNDSVAAYCAKAEELMQNGDVGGAYKQLELASRLDAGNATITKLKAKIEPKWQKMEAARKAKLSGPEAYKEKGDDAYKQAKFEEAIVDYTKCIDALLKSGKGQSELALKAYSNRAACYKQISNFDGTIQDCSAVLEVEPSNVKALIRRAQAFEGVERYRFALQDVKTVLSLPYAEVGKQNFDLCNGMQHRLQRTVGQLKEMSGSQ